MKTTEAGRIIKYIKAKSGMSNREIGKIFGFHENTIYGWINGKQRPSYDDVIMFIDYFKLDTSQIRVEVNIDNTKNS